MTPLSTEEELELLEYEARIDVAAIEILPWETGRPVARHVAAEGIDV